MPNDRLGDVGVEMRGFQAMRRLPMASRAMVWGEVLAVLAVGAALTAGLVVALSRSRTVGGLGQSSSNLRQIYDVIATYGTDNADLAPGFSWKKGKTSSSFADLRNPSSDIDAAAYQAVDIIRRRSNVPGFQKLLGWLPHLYYVHLPMADYLNSPLPLPFGVSPGDKNLIRWSSDPSKWQQNGAPSSRAPFAMSYETYWGLWALTDSGSNAISQDGLSYTTTSLPSSTVMGQRQLSAVIYPAHKAAAWEEFQRFLGPREGFFMYDEARVPVAMFDGAVALRAGKNSNNGWKPQNPASTNSSSILYDSGGTVDPKPLNDVSADVVRGKYRWTRKGVAGRDFDGPEIP